MSSISSFLQDIDHRFNTLFQSPSPGSGSVFSAIAWPILQQLRAADAPYHDLECTRAVLSAGQAMLEGQQICEGSLTSAEGLHVLVALLCSNLGCLRGACLEDRVAEHVYSDGVGGSLKLLPGSSGGALLPYCVDRSQEYALTHLVGYPQLDMAMLNACIEMTRLPVPYLSATADSCTSLCRIASLIGQLSHPHYQQRLMLLEQELQEAREQPRPVTVKSESYYPHMHWSVAHPALQVGLRCLSFTAEGQHLVPALMANACTATLRQRHGLPRCPTDSSGVGWPLSA